MPLIGIEHNSLVKFVNRVKLNHKLPMDQELIVNKNCKDEDVINPC